MSTYKVLVAVDSSEIAEKTCKWYFENLHKDENAVTIAHLAESPRLPTLSIKNFGSFPTEEIKEIIDNHNQTLEKLKFKYIQISKGNNNVKYEFKTALESAGPAIVKEVEEGKFNMVVMGSRGLGVIRRQLLGSVSDYVLHHCNVPITICHF